MPVPQSETWGKQTAPPKTSSSLQVEITRLTPLWPRKVFVQWILRNPQAATGYIFHIYRSSGPEGPWVEVTDPTTGLTDTYFFVDDTYEANQDRSTIGQVQLRMAVYYKVVAQYGTDTPVETMHNVDGSLDHRRLGIFRKLTRDAYVALRKGNGTEVAILKRMWYGAPCTVCRTSTGQSARAHCATCNGTGIITGYWNPIYTFARRTATPMDTRTGTQGIVEANRMMAILPSFPEIAAKDILVFLRDNRRYMIERVNTTELHAVVVHQECDITELARTSREYSVKVDPYHDPKWF